MIATAQRLLPLAMLLIGAPQIALAEANTDPLDWAHLWMDPPEAQEPVAGAGSAVGPREMDGAVAATVDGQEILWRDVLDSARELPEKYQGQVDTVASALLSRLIDLKLLATAGRDAGLDEDPRVRQAVSAFEDRVIGEALVKRWIAMQITEDLLRTRYEAYLKELAARAEVRARHILVDNEDDARDIIEALDGGADFAELARSRSLGATAELGGDLDYFTRDSMVPEFAAAAFRLGVGEHSRVPIRTQFGWHVIKVEDRRAEDAIPFAEMRERLHAEARREALLDLLRQLRAAAAIEVFPATAPKP